MFPLAIGSTAPRSLHASLSLVQAARLVLREFHRGTLASGLGLARAETARLKVKRETGRSTRLADRLVSDCFPLVPGFLQRLLHQVG